MLSDLPAAQWQACCYGLRAWIEHGFKLTKSEGWQWQRTRIQDPQRAARLWLVLAVATLRVVTTGSHAEDVADQAELGVLRGARRVSLFRRGWIAHLVALWQGQEEQLRWPPGRLQPAPWPTLPLALTLGHDTS